MTVVKARKRVHRCPALKAQEVFAEALKHPGVRQLMEVYQETRKAEIAIERYLAVYSQSEQFVVTGVSTAASG